MNSVMTFTQYKIASRAVMKQDHIKGSERLFKGLL